MIDDPVRRASRAKTLLADDLVSEALDRMMKAAVDDFRNSKAGDDDARRAAWHRAQAIKEFKATLSLFVSDGSVIAFQARQG